MCRHDILISVIVPVYNVEMYLEECINSIISYSKNDIEIILVDDGSSDSSGKICNVFAEKDKRIIVIHQKNQGVSVARNVGMGAASGKWITFVDGDDYLAKTAVDIFKDACMRSMAELIVFDHIEFFDGLTEANNPPHIKTCVLDNEDSIKLFQKDLLCRASIQETKLLKYYGDLAPQIRAPWAKLYRRNFIERNKILFDSGIPLGEDMLFLFHASQHLTSVKFVSKQVYLYRRNPKSVTVKFTEDIVEMHTRYFEILKRIMDDYDDWFQDDLRKAFYRNALVMVLIKILSGGAYHKDCPWNAVERAKWLEILCSQTWLRESLENFDQIYDKTERMVQFEKLYRQKDYRAMDRYYTKYYNSIHIKERIVSWKPIKWFLCRR